MKRFLLVFSFLITFCLSAHSQSTGLADLKFGRYQIADSQWNVSACMNTTTCQIYSKNPGTAYKIPWTSGQIQWAAGDYIQFQPYTKDANNPWLAVQFDSNGVGKTNMGLGHIINMGADFFFFVGSDNNTGQLFSMTQGFANTSGVTWTGTRNPTVEQVNAYAANGSTTPLAAGQTATPAAPAAPSLCCGGSSASFNATPADAIKVQNFVNRTTADSKVFIEQVGNQNKIVVNQTGTKNNYVNYYGNGMSNDIDVKQQGNITTQANYVDLRVVGNFNTVKLEQTSTGGAKGVFANVTDNTNTLNIQQKDNGSHYAEIDLTGGNKKVDILQQGSASHMARIQLGGYATELSLTQSGSTQQFYSIGHTCTTAGGCAKITVGQGQ